jgi:hypothetical protein
VRSSGDGDFDKFWAAYPRKCAKGDALKAWKALKPDASLVADMLLALSWQRDQDQWTRDGGAFIPYPATWLRAMRWEDEPVAVAPTAPKALAGVVLWMKDRRVG